MLEHVRRGLVRYLCYVVLKGLALPAKLQSEVGRGTRRRGGHTLCVPVVGSREDGRGAEGRGHTCYITFASVGREVLPAT